MNVYQKIAAGEYSVSWDNSLQPVKKGAPGYEEYLHLLDEYRQRRYHLERVVFKADALEEVGLTGHPKADQAFALAWDRGHANGLHEVLGELGELAELLL